MNFVCLLALLENHILPHVMCIPAVVGEHRVRTMGSGKVSFDCDKKGVKVANKPLRSEFTMGENGVLYVVDHVLLPDRGELEIIKCECTSTT